MFTCYNVPFKSVEEKEGSFHLPIEVVMVFIDLLLVLVTSAGLNLLSGPHVETQRISETKDSLGFGLWSILFTTLVLTFPMFQIFRIWATSLQNGRQRNYTTSYLLQRNTFSPSK